MSTPTVAFGPARGFAALFGTAAVVAALAGAFIDRPGAVLGGLVAVGFASLAVSDLVATPRLLVDETGITVRSVAGARRLPWAQIERVRVDERSRFGRLVRTLEIDAGEHLAVLGARVLGVDPAVAAGRIVAAAPPEQRLELGRS